MTSREIAELTGKEHDKVRRDIRHLAEQLSLSFEEKVELSDGGHPAKLLILQKRETLILVSGYSVALTARGNTGKTGITRTARSRGPASGTWLHPGWRGAREGGGVSPPPVTIRRAAGGGSPAGRLAMCSRQIAELAGDERRSALRHARAILTALHGEGGSAHF